MLIWACQQNMVLLKNFRIYQYQHKPFNENYRRKKKKTKITKKKNLNGLLKELKTLCKYKEIKKENQMGSQETHLLVQKRGITLTTRGHIRFGCFLLMLYLFLFLIRKEGIRASRKSKFQHFRRKNNGERKSWETTHAEKLRKKTTAENQ